MLEAQGQAKHAAFDDLAKHVMAGRFCIGRDDLSAISQVQDLITSCGGERALPVEPAAMCFGDGECVSVDFRMSADEADPDSFGMACEAALGEHGSHIVVQVDPETCRVFSSAETARAAVERAGADYGRDWLQETVVGGLSAAIEALDEMKRQGEREPARAIVEERLETETEPVEEAALPDIAPVAETQTSPAGPVEEQAGPNEELGFGWDYVVRAFALKTSEKAFIEDSFTQADGSDVRDVLSRGLDIIDAHDPSRLEIVSRRGGLLAEYDRDDGWETVGGRHAPKELQVVIANLNADRLENKPAFTAREVDDLVENARSDERSKKEVEIAKLKSDLDEANAKLASAEREISDLSELLEKAEQVILAPDELYYEKYGIRLDAPDKPWMNLAASPHEDQKQAQESAIAQSRADSAAS